jgi:hypothetical protein
MEPRAAEVRHTSRGMAGGVGHDGTMCLYDQVRGPQHDQIAVLTRQHGVHTVTGAKRVGRRVLVSLVAVAAMSALSDAGPTGAAASIGYHETYTQTVDAGHGLNAVSCVPGTTDCVAADSEGDAFYATNVSATSAATWNFWSGPGPSPSEAVECPSATLCLLAAGEVSGGGGNLYRASSLGGSFLTSFKPTNGVVAVSCPSTSFCVSAQAGGGFIRYSTNPSGILWTSVSIGSGAMKDVSCLSASFCAVADHSGNVRVATTEKGVKEAPGWTATNVNGEAPLDAIACSSTTSCVAVDGSDEVLNLTIGPSGEATASKQGIDGANGLIAVDCTGATCSAVDDQGGIFASTNAGADWIVRHGEGAGLTSVSCASPSLCAAVTTTGDVTAFNPATTTLPLTITSGSLPVGEVGAPYEVAAQATGGEGPYQWSAIGLPSGLSIDQASGEISGTPAKVLCVGEPCHYAVTLTVTDGNGTQASAALTIALAVNAHALRVSTEGTGSGEVNSSPAGIGECGTPTGSCEAPYEDGTVVTLTAKPTAGSTFAGWSGGGCSGTGACQITVSAETDVSSTFNKVSPPPSPAHTLAIKLAGSGEGGVEDGTGAISCPPACAHAYVAGTRVTLAANPARGSRFTGWSGGGCSGKGVCQLTIGADTMLVARFKEGSSAPARSRVLVSYRQEGGIGGPRPSLVVSRDRSARVTLGRCTAKFALQPAAWSGLRAALRGAHLHAIAGDYPPPKGSADVITYVIKAGRNTVRIAPAPKPENEKAMRDLRPLLKVLNKTVSAGKRRMPSSCKSNPT